MADTITGNVDKIRLAGNVYQIVDSKTRAAIAPDYSSSNQYSVNDVAFHGNSLYICTAATTGTWDSTKWSEATVIEIVEAMIGRAINS